MAQRRGRVAGCLPAALARGAAVIFIIFSVVLPGRPRAGELTPGGSFEEGGFPAGWVHSGANSNGGTNDSWADHSVVLDMPYGGSYSALLGFKYTPQKRDRNGFMYRDVAIPADVSDARLFFRFRQQGYDGLNYDPFIVEVRDLSGNVLATVVNFSFSEANNQFKDSGWIEGGGAAGFDMSPWAGQTVRIHFRQENTNDNLFETWAFVDDVSLLYSKYVDLVVDGNGNDVFGDPGTGTGGISSSSGEAGGVVSYLIDVENESLGVDSYTISASPPAGWTAVLTYAGFDYSMPWTTPPVPGGSSIQVTVTLTIPSGEPMGTGTTIVDGVSTTDPLRFDSATLETNVVPASHLTDLAIDSYGLGVIDPAGGGGGSSTVVTGVNSTVEYSVELSNAGGAPDSFRVWFEPEPLLSTEIEYGGTAHTGAFYTGTIDPGTSETFTLRVSVPLSVSGGDYQTLVFAHALSDTLKKDGVTAVTRVFAPRVDMLISGSGDGIIDPTGAGLGGNSTLSGLQGTVVYFPVTVQNESGIPDSFTMTWTRPSGNWTAVLNDGTVDRAMPWTTPTIPPYSQAEYTLAVSIPPNAAFNTYTSVLEAVSETDGNVRESVTAGVSVTSGNETDLIIDGDGDDLYGALGSGLGGSSVAYADRGDTVYFELTVQNESGANTFDIEWNTPAGWAVLLDGAASPASVAAGVYQLMAVVPLSCAGGTFDIVIDGMKSNKRYYVDSVRGTVEVSTSYIVDALIDGDGDEVIGTPGLGGGGAANLSTTVGRTVSFVLELQNQGIGPESYRVAWPQIPGWTATLDGSTSPMTTPVIAGGTSGSWAFQVTVPVTAVPGDYAYILDVVSTIDPANTESVTAGIHVDPPAEVDLVIDGQGAFVTGTAGSGGGGSTIVFGAEGAMATSQLEVFNRGGTPDSFEITWSVPAGWPAGLVVLFDGAAEHSSPFTTAAIPAGGSLAFTIRAYIPSPADLRSQVVIDGRSLTLGTYDSVLLELVTAAFVAGRVFDDADHDGAFDSGETGWPGVALSLSDVSAPLTAVSSGDGSFIFEVAAGASRVLTAATPSGMISLSPDTVSTGALTAGDTVFIYFADVQVSSIAPALSRSGPAGGFIELPHSVTAGTAGQAIVAAALPAGWAGVWYRDVNGDGTFDAGDTPLTSADLDLDPSVPGRDAVPLILRVFVPATVPAGTTGQATVTLYQTLSGTTISTSAALTDQLTVMASSSGSLSLVKQVDMLQAQPGDTITYTIVFTNPGTDDVMEIEIMDPVSPAVELVTGSFGPGGDIEWVRGGSSVYLTADPSDADEGMFDAGTGTLRVVLSRQLPFSLAPGEEGRIVYRVRVR